MPAHGAILRVQRDGGAPQIELVFGHAQWGKYDVYLWDAAGHQPTLLRRGLNNDQIPDVFPIALTARELDRAQLTWEVTIGALSAKGPQYSLQVRITQDGRLLSSAPYSYSGSLDAVKVIADFVKFRAA